MLKMKLTTMDVHSSEDLCPKARPPRIGDIPRPVAIDEESESPGSSVRYLPEQEEEEENDINIENIVEEEEEEKERKRECESDEEVVDEVKEIDEEEEEDLLKELKKFGGSLRDIVIKDNDIVKLSIGPIKEKFKSKIDYLSNKKNLNIDSSKVNNPFINELTSIDLDKRKDSAVCLFDEDEDDDDDDDDDDEEKKIEEFRERLCDNKDIVFPSIQRKLIPSNLTSYQQDILYHENEESSNNINNTSSNRFRSKYCHPRRESSGYFSNLSTFDDDRRSSITIDNLFQRERRRSSSIKNKLYFKKNDDDNSDSKMLTSELNRKVSTAGLEMPNIKELKEDVNLINPALKQSNDDDNKIQTDQVIDKISQFTLNNQPELKNDINQFSISNSSNNLTELDSKLDKDVTKCKNCSQPVNSSTLECDCTIEKSSTLPSTSSNKADDDINNSYAQLDHNKKYFLPKSVKFYQLLSTQSEDRGDGELKLMDRRISLQIIRQDNEEPILKTTSTTPSTSSLLTTTSTTTAVATTSTASTTTLLPEDKKFHHADSVPLIKIRDTMEDNQSCVLNFEQMPMSMSIASVRKLSSPGEMDANQKLLTTGNECHSSHLTTPQGSPRIKKRPLRESRRVSIDNSTTSGLQLNQYKLLDNIGQGSYGIVKLVYNEEDKYHYAMKILSKKKLMKKAGIFGRMAPRRKGISNPLAKVYREIALLKKLDHTNVVKLIEVLDDPDEDNLYLVFELVQRGEVIQIPTDKPLDEEIARKHFRDIVLGVEYLHYQMIVHRDIKPSNLLVDAEGRVKIADLGVSAELRASGELLTGSAGTPAFAAPETTLPGAQYSGTLCDIWSMGVTLYCMVTGNLPWDGSGSIIGVQVAIRTEPLKFPDKPELSKDLKDLLRKMLDKDPTKRSTLQQVRDHCWLTKYATDLLPSEADNCQLPITVTDEEVAHVVTKVPKLDTLILIKTMLKQHSFQNPFLSKKIVK